MSRNVIIGIVCAAVVVLGLMIATAVIAFRINHEIKNSFVTVNNSIKNSNDSLNVRNDKSIQALQHVDTTQSEGKELLSTMDAVVSNSENTTAYINELISKLENSGTGDADLNVTTKLLAEGPDGRILQDTLGCYKADMDRLMKAYPLNESIPIDTTAPKGAVGETVKRSWQQAYFHMVPRIVAITILTKFKNDVKTTEAMCLKRLSHEKPYIQ